MSQEGCEQQESMRQARTNVVVTCIVRAEQDNGSTFPPSYEAAIGEDARNRSKVFVEYYLVEIEPAEK